MRWELAISPSGTRQQSGIPKGSPARNPLRANGMTFRGVVVAVYVYDSPEGPNTIDVGAQPNALYCDVLCYGRYEGVIPRVLVTFDRSGMHEGEISIPRAARIAANETLDPDHTNPANMDGDHVIVGFIEDNTRQPYIQKYIPHPSSDIGNSSKPAGQRMRLKVLDGEPRLWKHKGMVWGANADGNFQVDLTEAHSGSYQADGSEPPVAGDGSVGHFLVLLPAGSTAEVRIDGGDTFLLDGKDSNANMTLGDGAVHPAISEHLETLYTQLAAQVNQLATDLNLLIANYNAHQHLTTIPTQPTTPGTPPAVGIPTAVQAPAWNTSIESTKVAIPDG